MNSYRMADSTFAARCCLVPDIRLISGIPTHLLPPGKTGRAVSLEGDGRLSRGDGHAPCNLGTTRSAMVREQIRDYRLGIGAGVKTARRQAAMPPWSPGLQRSRATCPTSGWSGPLPTVEPTEQRLRHVQQVSPAATPPVRGDRAALSPSRRRSPAEVDDGSTTWPEALINHRHGHAHAREHKCSTQMVAEVICA